MYRNDISMNDEPYEYAVEYEWGVDNINCLWCY